MLQHRKGKLAMYKGNLNKPKYLFIGEAPGTTEDKTGEPFTGKSGQILDEWLHQNKISTHDCAVINSVPIMPTTKEEKTRKPTPQEIQHFQPEIKKLIKNIQPKHTILLGRSAEKTITNQNQMKNLQTNKNTSFIYHPSYYLRNGRTGNKDFKKLITKIEKKRKENNGRKQ